MNKTGRYYLDLIDRLRDEKLAEAINIAYDDLVQTEFEFKEIKTDSGAMINYLISFSESSPKEILDRIRQLHGGLNVELSPYHDFSDDFLLVKFEFDAIRANKNYVGSFQSEVANLRQLNKLKTDTIVLDSILKKQIFISAITILETFLSEAFINQSNDNKIYFKNFIESYPEFKTQKFTINEIFNYSERLESIAKKEMMKVIYHNLGKVKYMYESTFKISFPKIDNLSKSIGIRHDLVHRNGKNKKGKPIIITDKTIENLLDEITKFVREIISEMKIIY